MVRMTRPVMRASSKGVFLHFDFSSLGSTSHGSSMLMTMTSAGAPLRKVPPVRPSSCAGRVDIARNSAGNSISPMYQAQTGGEHGLQSDSAGGGFRKRQAFVFDVLWIVIRHYHVDQAFGQSCDQCLAVVLGAQRWRYFEEGSVWTDVVLVEREMIDRGRRTHLMPGFAGAAQHLKRFRAGDRSRVIAATGERDQARVASQHYGFGCIRDSKQAKARAIFAFVHDTVADQIGILGVMYDQRIKVARVSQRAPHHLRINDAFVAVGEGTAPAAFSKPISVIS